MYVSKLLLVSQSTYLQKVSYQRSITGFVSALSSEGLYNSAVDDIMRKHIKQITATGWYIDILVFKKSEIIWNLSEKIQNDSIPILTSLLSATLTSWANSGMILGEYSAAALLFVCHFIYRICVCTVEKMFYLLQRCDDIDFKPFGSRAGLNRNEFNIPFNLNKRTPAEVWSRQKLSLDTEENLSH